MLFVLSVLPCFVCMYVILGPSKVVYTVQSCRESME